MVRRVLMGLVVILVLGVGAFAAWVASRQNLRFEAPFPAITASTDSAAIARGHYIVRRLAPCSICHGEPERIEAARNGEETALSGGYVFDIPPGRFHVPNITPDDETGIGRIPDGALARALRDGIRHDGRALLPFMEMQGLADDDLGAVLSYLRSQPAVSHAVPPHEPNLLGRVVLATALSKPVGPSAPPPAQAPRGATVENGRYLVESVALCGACHTQRNEMTGAFTGPHLAGATGFTSDDHTITWSPPNLTPDPDTGKLAGMSEDAFVERFRAGRLLPGSPMPWTGFQHLDEADLRAIYLYLQTVPPVRNDVGPPIVPRKKS